VLFLILKLIILNLIPTYLLDLENWIWVFMQKPIQFIFYNFFSIPVLLVSFHMGENLETSF
jgi:hypothetical protein